MPRPTIHWSGRNDKFAITKSVDFERCQSEWIGLNITDTNCVKGSNSPRPWKVERFSENSMKWSGIHTRLGSQKKRVDICLQRCPQRLISTATCTYQVLPDLCPDLRKDGFPNDSDLGLKRERRRQMVRL